MLLISPDNHFGLVGFLFAVVAVSFWLERFSWARRLSATLLVIAIPLAFSNLGLVPREAPAYAFVSNYFVATAIPLLLFKSDLKRIFSETGRVMVGFIIAAVGTLAGAVLAYALIPAGEDGGAVAAVVTGGYIGGSMNFVAVAQSIGLDEPTRFATVLGAEATAGLLYLVFLSLVPGFGWFRRWAAAGGKAGDVADPEAGDGNPTAAGPKAPGSIAMGSDGKAPGLPELALALGLSLSICGAGNWIATAIGFPQYGILVITALAVAAANIAPGPLGRLRGDMELGMLLMFAFFAVFGAGTDLAGMIRDAPILLVFCATMVTIHFLVAFGVGRLAGLEAEEVAIASNACLLGPPTAAAEAVRNGWHDLVTPGLLCGVFGYAVGNFIGVTLFALLG